MTLATKPQITEPEYKVDETLGNDTTILGTGNSRSIVPNTLSINLRTAEISDEAHIVLEIVKKLKECLLWANKIEHTERILTDGEKHNLLHLALSWDVGNFNNLTNAEKLRILDMLFECEKENLKNLDDNEKLELLRKLFLWEGWHWKEEDILTSDEKCDILMKLFWLKRGELDSSFLYKWKWADLYDKISNDKSYPFIDIENEYLAKLRYNKIFMKILENTDYITDVGCWNIEKFKKTVGPDWKWKRVKWKGKYIPADYSAEMLKIAVNNFKRYLTPYIKLWTPQLLINNEHLTGRLNKNMYFFLWWTICNMSDEKIVEELTNMDNDWYFSWNKILLSYFTAPNSIDEVKNLIRIYNSESNKAFHENGLDMLWLSREYFEFDTIYELDDWTKLKLENWELKPYEWSFDTSLKWPFPWRIKWIIRAKKDTKVQLHVWMTIEVKKWQEFTLHYSRRFTKKYIKDLFKRCGCKIITLYKKKTKKNTKNEPGDEIVLLERAPTKRKSVIRGVRNSIISAILWATVVACANYYQDYKTHKEKKDYTTQWERKRSISDQEGLNYALESQESKEFLAAIWLDEANDEVKKTINFSYNSYVQAHKGESISREELMSRYRDEYWWTLINEFGAKSPYSFITKELIDNTYYASNNGISDEKHFRAKEFKAKGYEFFEFNDYWDEYIIIKAYIWKESTPIYLAGKKGNSSIITFSTNSIENIMNKEKLDKKILANNNNLKTNLLTRCRVHDDWNIDILYSGLYIIEDCINFENFKTHTIYLKWKIYYIKKGKTESWYEVLWASKSPDWPFSVTMFNNEISEDFHNARYMWIPSNHKQRIKDRAYPSSHQMGVRPSIGKLKSLDDVKSDE